MFYCVYFFSPFCFQPVLRWLLTQGLVPLWEVSDSVSHSEAATAFLFPCCALPFIQNGVFPFPRSPLSSPVVDSYSVIKAQLKYPSVLGKHLPSPPSASRTSLPPALFIPELHGSCHRGIVCCYVWEGLCSLGGPLESGDNAFVISEYPVLC